jgi:hypothetical protein
MYPYSFPFFQRYYYHLIYSPSFHHLLGLIIIFFLKKVVETSFQIRNHISKERDKWSKFVPLKKRRRRSQGNTIRKLGTFWLANLIKKYSIWTCIKKPFNHFGQVNFDMFIVIGVVFLIGRVWTIWLVILTSQIYAYKTINLWQVGR